MEYFILPFVNIFCLVSCLTCFIKSLVLQEVAWVPCLDPFTEKSLRSVLMWFSIFNREIILMSTRRASYSIIWYRILVLEDFYELWYRPIRNTSTGIEFPPDLQKVLQKFSRLSPSHSSTMLNFPSRRRAHTVPPTICFCVQIHLLIAIDPEGFPKHMHMIHFWRAACSCGLLLLFRLFLHLCSLTVVRRYNRKWSASFLLTGEKTDCSRSPSSWRALWFQ